MRKPILLVAAALLVFSGPAWATIVQVDASSIQGQNVLFNNAPQQGATIVGQTSQSNTLVDFTGTTVGGGTIIRSSGGQAAVEGALDSMTQPPNDTIPLSSLNFRLAAGGTFNNLELNVFGGTSTQVNFAITDNENQVTNFNNLALGNGSNFFGFQGILGESILSVAATFNGGGINDVRQIRLDPMTAAIPEASTWAMIILGFAGVGFVAYRRKNQGPGFRFG